MKRNLLAAIAMSLALPLAGLAAEVPGTIGPLADGEVRKVDKDAKKLTIRHGPLPQFDMPTPMTMVYQVKDPALLDQVKPGDKIRFEAEKIGGLFTVIHIELAK
jgi:Cu(I)/Ag(I) efflux system protein CusF